MKKTLLAIGMIAVFTASSSFGQGTVVFGNGTGTKISTNSVPGGVSTGLTAINPGTAAAQTTAAAFYYALFYSTTATNGSGVNGSLAGALGTNGTYAFN